LTFVDSNTRDQHCIIYFEVVLEFIKHWGFVSDQKNPKGSKKLEDW
jgi:hypothetical protein